MVQRLILPINRCVLTASWKSAAYRLRFFCTHYGADLISAAGGRTVYASGNGLVLAVGTDNVVGNVVAVLYRNALNRRSGKACDIVFRYFHLDTVAVKEGQAVTKDTVLGGYGDTGSMTMGKHLHLEADTDTSHPLYSPTVSRSSYLRGRAMGANDLSISNPLDWIYCKVSGPDNQSYATAEDSYIAAADKLMENIR